MLNIDLVENTIDELEHTKETNYELCRDLAALYIVRDYYEQKYEKKKFNSPIKIEQSKDEKPKSEIVSELQDILPMYRIYQQTKRSYQRHETTKDIMLISMRNVCIEIKEFIETLYNNTDTEEERREIKQMLMALKNKVL